MVLDYKNKFIDNEKWQLLHDDILHAKRENTDLDQVTTIKKFKFRVMEILQEDVNGVCPHHIKMIFVALALD